MALCTISDTLVSFSLNEGGNEVYSNILLKFFQTNGFKICVDQEMEIFERYKGIPDELGLLRTWFNILAGSKDVSKHIEKTTAIANGDENNKELALLIAKSAVRDKVLITKSFSDFSDYSDTINDEEIELYDKDLGLQFCSDPNQMKKRMERIADVLIVTTTPVEKKSVIEALKEILGKEPTPFSANDRVYFKLGIINGARVFLLQSPGMGSGGVGGSQEEVRRAVETLAPSKVIMVGIAFGVDEENQSIGDVLLSSQLKQYEHKRIGTDSKGELKIILRGARPPASPSLINFFESAYEFGENYDFKLVKGILLSGDNLVDNLDFRNQLLSLEEEAIGGEMEGAGLAVACQNAKTDWVIVKAICDWGDGKKNVEKNKRQRIAAKNAARFVINSLNIVPILGG